MTLDPTNIALRPAHVSEAALLAELTLYSGENLLTQAFGGKRSEALHCLEGLCRAWGTMFSYEYTTIAFDGAETRGKPIGLVIAHPSSADKRTGQRLGEVVVGHRGWLRWLKMVPVAIALERCAEPIPPNVTYVSILAVHPDYRGLGIGSKLLRFAEEKARTSGDPMVCLDVEIDNDRAIKFYERLGYHTIAEHPASQWLRRKGITGLRRVEKSL